MRLTTSKSLKIIQCNLDRCYNAQSEFLHYFTSNKYDVAFITEPYTSNTGSQKNIYGLNTYQFKSSERVKATIVTRADIGATVGVSEFSTSNLCIIQLITKQQIIYLVSIYIEPIEDKNNTLNKLDHFIKNHQNARIIIAGDLNGWHPQWGSAKINNRGKDILHFTTSNDLVIGNTGTTPTFESTRHNGLRTSYIDLSIYSLNIANYIKSWKVNLEACPTSEHNAIDFTLELDKHNKINKRKKQSTYKYTTQYANWSDFKTKLRTNINTAQLDTMNIKIYNEQELEKYITHLTETIQKTCDETLGLKRNCNPINTIPWWNPQLEDLKKQVIKLHHRIQDLKRSGKPLEKILKERSEIKDKYIEALSKESSNSFREFCTLQGKENVWSLTNRLIKSGPQPTPPSTMRKDDGTFTTSATDTVEALIRKFYPDDTEDRTDTQKELRRQMSIVPDTENETPFTEIEVLDHLKNMNSKKAPGPDHLTADICLAVATEYPNMITEIMNRCVELAYFPKQWKIAQAIVLPKPNKTDYSDTSSYRPIGLLNVFGKLLEKLLTKRLTYHINKNNFGNPQQYGFTEQKSTVDALREAISKVRTAKANKEHVIAVSLDIQAAFDNAWWPVLFKRLKIMHCPKNYYCLIHNYIQDRTINLHFADQTQSKVMTKGCVQGSVCGPLFWNIILDDLFTVQLPEGCHLQAFADDVLLIVHNRNVHSLQIVINSALNQIIQWGLDAKLNFGPNKTQAIAFTRKSKTVNITIATKKIEYVDQIKLLGVIIDKNLKFIPHVKYITQKANKVYGFLCKYVRPTWGVNSENIKIIYEQVIQPIITYAAGIWGDAIKYKTACDTLRSTQRMFAVNIIRGFRTVSATAAIALASLIPIHLKIKEIHQIENAKFTETCNILSDDITIEKPVPPSDLLHPADRITININKATNVEELNLITDHQSQKIYTDGSKLSDGRTGAAFIAFHPDGTSKGKKFRLHSCCTVFQAELYAIDRALGWALSKRYYNITILSDSLASLKAIQNKDNNNPLVMSIHKNIKEIVIRPGNVVFVWVKSHVGLDGNEAADRLAKSAATAHMTFAYAKFPLSYLKHHLQEQTQIDSDNTYRNSATGQFTKAILPDLKSIEQIYKSFKPCFALTQFLTGHGYHLQYLKRFKVKSNDKCPCNYTDLQTLQHLLEDCPRYSQKRQDHMLMCNYLSIKKPFDILEVATTEETTKTYITLIKYIVDTLKEFNKHIT